MEAGVIGLEVAIMGIRPTVLIQSELDSFAKALLTRLLRCDLRLAVNQSQRHFLMENHSLDLEFGQVELIDIADFTSNDGAKEGYWNISIGAIHPEYSCSGAQNLLLVDADAGLDGHAAYSCLYILDMIPAGEVNWFNSPFTRWYEQLAEPLIGAVIGGEESANLEHWWVAQTDVVDAIVRLVIAGVDIPPLMHICGRKSWTEGQSIEEIEMLLHRVNSGLSGRFDLQSLQAPSSPVLEVEQLLDKMPTVPNQVDSFSSVVPISTAEANAGPSAVSRVGQGLNAGRPDLSEIHDALIEADGDGWRPMTPLRTGLMHFIAGMQE